MASNNVKELNDGDFAEVIASGIALVDFWAPWCGPCRAQSPIIEALADDLAGKAIIAKLNVDENPRTAARFSVRSIPTMLVFKDGEVIEQLIGLQTKEKLSALLAEKTGS